MVYYQTETVSRRPAKKPSAYIELICGGERFRCLLPAHDPGGQITAEKMIMKLTHGRPYEVHLVIESKANFLK